jgi:hypothetical protein
MASQSEKIMVKKLRKNVFLHPGAIIAIPRPFYSHYAIFAGVDSASNEPIVIHNDKVLGVHCDFLRRVVDKSRFRVTDTPRSWPEAMRRVKWAKRWIGTPYDALNFNCEHFVRLVVSGRAESRQVQDFASGLIFIGVTSLGLKWLFSR